jgi:NADH-quinone oxidoreductase subunit L
MFAWVIGVLVAGLTSFYSWRLAFFTFNGQARWGHDDHHAHDAHAAHGHEDHAHAETHDEPLPARARRPWPRP